MNNRFVQLIFLVCTSVLVSSVGSTERVFHIEMNLYENDTTNFNEIEIYENGKPSDYYGNPGNYSFYLENRDKEVLWKEERKLTWFMLSDPPQPIEKLPISKNIPYRDNATVFGLEKNNQTLVEIEIPNRICSNLDDTCTSYCKGKIADIDCTCGDGICQEDLNEDELCPQDCETPSQPNQQDQEADNEANQEDQSDTVNTSQEQPVEVVDSGTNTGILVLIGILFIVVALILASGKVSIEA